MNNWRFIGGRFRCDSARQWAPTLTAHDPNPPLNLENPSAGSTIVEATLSAAGSATGNFSSAAKQAATLTASASASATWNSASKLTTTLSAAVSATGNFSGAFKQAATLAASASASVTWNSASILATTLSAAGPASAAFVSSVISGTTWTATASSLAEWTGEDASTPAVTVTIGGGRYLNSPRLVLPPEYFEGEEDEIMAIGRYLVMRD